MMCKLLGHKLNAQMYIDKDFNNMELHTNCLRENCKYHNIEIVKKNGVLTDKFK